MKRFVWLITLCLLLMITPSSFFSENAKGGLEETTLWSTIDLTCLDSDESPSTLLSDGTWLYLGTFDITAPYEAGIYRIDANGDCTAWQTTDSHFIYSSYEHSSGDLYWGTRALPSPSLSGDLYTWDGATFSKIPRTTWYDFRTIHAGWSEAFFEFSGDLFIGGTGCDIYCRENNSETGWAKRYDGVNWNWVDVKAPTLVGDVISWSEYMGVLYAGTYDAAGVFRFYPGNDTLWPDFWGTNVDGPPAANNQGVYFLNNSSGCLRAWTYKLGRNHTKCDSSSTWLLGDQSTNDAFARGMTFGSKVYHGVLDGSTYYIQTWDNQSFQAVFESPDSGHFQYFEQFNSELYATNENNLYVRHSNTVAKIRITSPTGGVNGLVRLTATVLTDRSVDNVKMVLAEYDTSFTLFKDPKRPVYYYEWFDTEHYQDGYYHFVARLNSTDGTSSWDNVSFEIDNSRQKHLKEDDDGNMKVTHQLPWVPRGDELPGPDYFVGLRYNDPYYIQVAHITESSSNPSTVHASYQPYDLNENDVEVTEDILWLSEVGDSSRTWTNDTHSTEDTSDDIILKNATSVLFVVLNGENITIQGDGYETFSFMRQSTLHTVNTVLWKEENDGSYTAHVEFYNNHTEPHDYTVFFVGIAEGRYTNDLIPMNPYKTTMYDYHNGLYLDMGIEYTVSHGGYWFAITGFPSASSRPFTFNYFPDTDDWETELSLTPYCDQSGYQDPERPIKCQVEHLQEGIQGFQGTIRFDLSQIRRFGKINWNKVILIDDANNLILKKGVDWYSSGDYEMMLINQEIDVAERVKFEIQVGVLETDPLEVVENINIEGAVCFAMGIPLFIGTIYFSREAMRSRGKKKRTAIMIALLWFALLVLVAIVFLPYILG